MLIEYASSIKSFASTSQDTAVIIEGVLGASQLRNPSRINIEEAHVFAVNPNSLMDGTMMYEYRDPGTTLGPTEQLYTARGSQGTGTGKKIESFGVDPENYDDLAILVVPNT